MGIEIEKKFMLLNDSWREKATGVAYLQGYLANEAGLTVRARIAGTKGYLTVKGPSQGAGRLEYEYQIPVEDAGSSSTRRRPSSSGSPASARSRPGRPPSPTSPIRSC